MAHSLLIQYVNVDLSEFQAENMFFVFHLQCNPTLSLNAEHEIVLMTGVCFVEL